MNENIIHSQYIEALDYEHLNVRVELKETIFSLNEDNAEKSCSSEEKAQEVEKGSKGLIMPS